MSTAVALAAQLAVIEEAMRGADRISAINKAVEALRQGVRHPLVWGLVAEGLEIQGRKAEALRLLQLSADAAPDNAQTWFRLGRILFSLDRRVEARDALDRGLTIIPRDYSALIDAGTVCLRLADLVAAAGHFRRAAEVDPEAAEPLSALAVVAALDGDMPAARAFAAHALTLSPRLVSAQIAIARADAAEGAPGLAEQRLTALLERQDLTDAQRIDAFDLRAECRDALDRCAEAFDDYSSRNATMLQMETPIFAVAGRETQGDRARRIAAWLQTRSSNAWVASAGSDTVGARETRRHVFLVGFPRSGTTLLERVLTSHPDIVALEEIDALGVAGTGLLDTDTGLKNLLELKPEEAIGRRRLYWNSVRQAMGEAIGDRIFVDKMPLHTVALPLIAQLFPDARILFALRDPRDVVLSCFRRRFRINAAMFEFLTLQGAARYYDTVMQLAAFARERLSLNLIDVRHEAVVADFDCEIRKVLDFLGAPWDPLVRGFATQVRTIPKTPSAPQVARGLNADGVAQWRRYQAQLTPVACVLAPWVERFGYDPAGL
ncbi:MAG TPA: sulfotransferase [Steroidobacteraceae bacterium]|jgi:tetratricopeptide (TPR) repeat protein